MPRLRRRRPGVGRGIVGERRGPGQRTALVPLRRADGGHRIAAVRFSRVGPALGASVHFHDRTAELAERFVKSSR